MTSSTEGKKKENLKPVISLFEAFFMDIDLTGTAEHYWAYNRNGLHGRRKYGNRSFIGFTFNPLSEGVPLKRGANFVDGQYGVCVIEKVGDHIVLASYTDEN